MQAIAPYNDLDAPQYYSVDELLVATDSEKHHTFYFESGDAIVHCRQTVFRVHLEVLRTHSWMYREMLGDDDQGAMTSVQRELPGVKMYIHYMGPESVEEYEFALMSFYRP